MTTTDQYLFFNRQTGQMRLVERTEKISVSLKKNGYCCLLFIAPLQIKSAPVIPIGLMDKYMSFHAVKTASISPDGQFLQIPLADGGRFGFAVEKSRPIQKIYANGQPVAWKSNREIAAEDGLEYCEAELSGKGLQTVVIQL